MLERLMEDDRPAFLKKRKLADPMIQQLWYVGTAIQPDQPKIPTQQPPTPKNPLPHTIIGLEPNVLFKATGASTLQLYQEPRFPPSQILF